MNGIEKINKLAQVLRDLHFYEVGACLLAEKLLEASYQLPEQEKISPYALPSDAYDKYFTPPEQTDNYELTIREILEVSRRKGLCPIVDTMGIKICQAVAKEAQAKVLRIQADRIKPNIELDLIAGELTRLLRAVGVLNYDTQPNNAELIMCVAEFCKADRHKDKREAIIDVLVSRCPFVDACIRQCTPTDQDVCFGEMADSLVPLFPTPKLTWQTFKEIVEGVEETDTRFLWSNLKIYRLGEKAFRKAILDAIEAESIKQVEVGK